MSLPVAVIGCGVIGERRARALSSNAHVVAVFDTHSEKAAKLAATTGARVYSSLEQLLEESSVKAAFVATVNSSLMSSAHACLRYGVPVLLEKPGARSSSELESLSTGVNTPTAFVQIGLNHRFHPAFQDLLKILKANPEDRVMYSRARYGNGARLGFEKEWRADPELAGGGELLDQGVHTLDLARCIFGNLKALSALSRTHYWDMPVDDNTWALLTTDKEQTVSMHVSSTEWKNEFQFDVYTRKRKFVWSGLGRSYGPETLTVYTMRPEMGPPDVQRFEYPPEDNSFAYETELFIRSALEGKLSSQAAGLNDAKELLKLVEDLYSLSKKTSPDAEHPQWFANR